MASERDPETAAAIDAAKAAELSFKGRIKINNFLRSCIFRVVSVGPLPTHIAFIMDGNHRYAKNMERTEGYKLGFQTFLSVLRYCYELHIPYVSVAFSIENFRREHEDVEFLMEMMCSKIEVWLEEASVAEKYGLRVNFVGNMNLLSEKLRMTLKRAMEETAKNDNIMVQICMAYTTTDEIVNAVEQSCFDKQWQTQKSHSMGSATGCEGWGDGGGERKIELAEIEKHMYLSVAPEPELLVTTSRQTRLSNFMLWQTGSCLLCFPKALWSEFGLWDLVWQLLCFQRHSQHLQNQKKWLIKHILT